VRPIDKQLHYQIEKLLRATAVAQAEGCVAAAAEGGEQAAGEAASSAAGRWLLRARAGAMPEGARHTAPGGCLQAGAGAACLRSLAITHLALACCSRLLLRSSAAVLCCCCGPCDGLLPSALAALAARLLPVQASVSIPRSLQTPPK
jgi:hypothetical protein